jgi:hypothetical protein
MDKREEQLLTVAIKFGKEWFESQIKSRHRQGYNQREEDNAARQKIEAEFIEEVLRWYNGADLVLEKLKKES